MEWLDRVEKMEEIFEGNTSTAELALRIIDSRPELDAETYAVVFANELRGFWDPDNGDTEDEHWENNFAWGVEAFEEYLDWEEEEEE